MRISTIFSTFAAKFEKEMNKVRITAIRQTVYNDLIEQYENSIEHTCDIRHGQQWISINGTRPDGLCPSAWESMRWFVESLAHGKEVMACNLSRRRPLLPKTEGRSGMKNPMSAMISCNDGFRPFSFYIEAIEEQKHEATEISIGQSTSTTQPHLIPNGKEEARVFKLVLVLGKQVLPRRQIIADLGLRQQSRHTFINNYLRPTWERGFIEHAYPNTPSKPEQAYRLTPKGLDLFAQLTDDTNTHI